MSVAKRAFADPRNTYVVRNDDPTAFDKSYLGQPGTHTEQRCCGDKAPYRETFYTDSKGYWTAPHEQLMCNACETALEAGWGQFVDGLAFALGEMSPAIRAIAMAASYIPVFGTAVSFLLTASLDLAQGQSIEESSLDAVGQALPGQPASGIAFNTARSVVRGDRIDVVALEALPPVLQPYKPALAGAIAVVEAVASGTPITELVLEQVHAQLSDSGKRAMDVARRLVSGERVSTVVASEAMRLVADAARTKAKALVDDAQAKGTALVQSAMRQGPAAVAKASSQAEAVVNTARTEAESLVNRFVAESGYQGSLQDLPEDLQRAVTTGLAAGLYERRQYMPTHDAFTSVEAPGDAATNDAYAAKGRAVLASSATWNRVPLAMVRARNTLTMTRSAWDALSGRYVPRVEHYDITDAWRRGFDVALGAHEGLSEPGPWEEKVRSSLVLMQAQQGWDAGQAIQFQRTQAAKELLYDVLQSENSQMTYALGKQEALTHAYAGRDLGASSSVAMDLARVAVAKAMDATARVQLTDVGSAIAMANPDIKAVRETLPDDWATRRGFDIGIALGYGPRTPWDDAQVRAGLNAADGTVRGFDQAIQLRRSPAGEETYNHLKTAPPLVQVTATATRAPQVPQVPLASFTYRGVSPVAVAAMEQEVAKDVLRLSMVRYYKQKKAADPTVPH